MAKRLTLKRVPLKKTTWTDEQEDIFDGIARGTDHMMVHALAGTGKTTTMVGALKQDKKFALSGKTRAITVFGRANGKELKEKVPPDVKAGTLHSLMFGIIRQQLALPSGKYAVNEKRDQVLLDEILGRRRLPRGGRWSISKLAGLAKNTGITPAEVKNPSGFLRELIIRHGISSKVPEVELISLTNKLLELSADEDNIRSTGIGFDDMIFLPYYLGLKPARKFDQLITDECQDTNVVQQYDALLVGNRIVAVGDVNQCQPSGTMILRGTPGTKWGPAKTESVPIESVKKGDSIVTWDQHGQAFILSGKVNAISKRQYIGNLFSISADGKTTRCTQNHRWLVRWAEMPTDKWCVYLMKKEIDGKECFRIGWCQLFNNQGCLHAAIRARLEDADALWILSVHDVKSEASIEESLIALQYQLPLVMFKSNGQATHYTQSYLDNFWKVASGSIDLCKNAERVLLAHGRRIEYPFWNKFDQKRQGRSTLFKTEACNLISGLMAIPAPLSVSSNRHSVKWVVLNVSAQPYRGVVHSLDVDKYHMYVADGLVTCNSIYGFRGADTEAMESLEKKLGSMRHYPLTICWRCPSEVINLAQKIVPAIRARPGAPTGSVEEISPDFLPKIVAPGDMVLCRTNAPLITLVFQLWAAGIRAYIQGRQFGQDLLDMVIAEEYEGITIDALSRKLQERMFREEAKLMKFPNSEGQIAFLHDKFDCLSNLIANSTSTNPREAVTELKNQLNYLFSDVPQDDKVRLSSIHRAKGLEALNVFIIEPHLLPHPMAQQPWEQQQESNLAYVAVTRSRMNLFFAGSIPPIFNGREQPDWQETYDPTER